MKTLFKYISVFLIALALMTFSLIAVAIIPREKIQVKSEESAEYLMKRDVAYYNIVGGSSGRSTIRPGDYSKIDQTADSYLLSIAYYFDDEHPLESVLWARYYEGREDTSSPLKNMNESYQRAVQEQVPTNKQYLRYWHGSLIFVRPMLMFWNIHQIKTFHAIELGILMLLLVALLIKHGLKAEAVCFGISMIVVSVWFVPFCLEYTWMFLLMLLAAIISVILVTSGRTGFIPLLFFLTGMCASYFDFFTTETITLLIPLLLVIRILYRRIDANSAFLEHDVWKLTGKSILLWGIGYVACWVGKWGLAAIVFNENTIPYVQGRLLVHLGLTKNMTVQQWMTGALIRNLSPLFPFGYGRVGGIIFFAMAFGFFFISVCRDRIALKKTWNKKRNLLYCVIGLIPYIRFLVLSQHSYRHYFFTYRAQAATILALCFIILELVEWNPRKDVMKNA